jgi:hypothetical protein
MLSDTSLSHVSSPCSQKPSLVSRILLTRQVINGFRIRLIDLLDIDQEELQLVVVQSNCNFNTS